MDLRIANKYRLGSKIGSGTFGHIHLGRNLQTNQEVAIKLEEIRTLHPQLLHEARIYRLLQGQTGISPLHWYGVEGEYNILVVDLLGPSLEDLFRYCRRTFSLKTVLLLAQQMLSRLEGVHTQGVLHRDIKPDNFLSGMGSQLGTLFLVDFGLARRFIDRKTGEHIPYRDDKKLIGTARYASLNTHLGIEQSRRDDLESVGYMLVYFLKGALPWQELAGATRKEKYQRILEAKAQISCADLCSDLPPEIGAFLMYCRALAFEEEPDYFYLRKLFEDLCVQSGGTIDHEFDWVLINKRKKASV